jgi:hypothetical protein
MLLYMSVFIKPTSVRLQTMATHIVGYIVDVSLYKDISSVFLMIQGPMRPVKEVNHSQQSIDPRSYHPSLNQPRDRHLPVLRVSHRRATPLPLRLPQRMSRPSIHPTMRQTIHPTMHPINQVCTRQGFI